jgi:hypothetical protein
LLAVVLALALTPLDSADMLSGALAIPTSPIALTAAVAIGSIVLILATRGLTIFEQIRQPRCADHLRYSALLYVTALSLGFRVAVRWLREALLDAALFPLLAIVVAAILINAATVWWLSGSSSDRSTAAFVFAFVPGRSLGDSVLLPDN